MNSYFIVSSRILIALFYLKILLIYSKDYNSIFLYKYIDSLIHLNNLPGFPFWFNQNPYSLTFLNYLKEQNCNNQKENDEKKFCYDLLQRKTMDVEIYGNFLLKKKIVPFVNNNKVRDNILAHSLLLLNIEKTNDSIQGFSKLISKYPEFEGGYYGRASALGRLNVQESLVQAIEDLSLAIQLSSRKISPYKNLYLVQRAMIYSKAGIYKECINDLTAIINGKRSWELFFTRGLHYLAAGHNIANFEHDLNMGMRLEIEDQTPNSDGCPVTLPYLGSLYINLGRIKEALNLHYKWEQCIETPQSILNMANAYRKLGDYDQSKYLFDAYLNLTSPPISLDEGRALNHEDENHASSHSFQHTFIRGGYAYKIDQKHGYYYRGLLNYESGNVAMAETDFQKCLSSDPSNIKCIYYKGVAEMTLGQFYESALSFTKVFANGKYRVHPFTNTKYFLYSIYLREYSRFLHKNLDEPVSKMAIDATLNENFKSSWLQNLYFDLNAKNAYTEQPPIDPLIKRVKRIKFSELKVQIGELLCKALKLGNSMVPRGDGHIYNRRLSLALGLGSIHLAQVLKGNMNKGVNMKEPAYKFESESLRWPDFYKLILNYVRVVDFSVPSFWLYDLPPEFLQKPKNSYSTRFYLLRRGERFLKHESYFKLVLNLVKTLIQHSENDQFTSFDETDPQLDKSLNCSELLAFAKHKINKEGLTVSTQLPSTVFESTLGKLDGVTVYLVEDGKNNHRGEKTEHIFPQTYTPVRSIEDDKISLYLEVNASITRNVSYMLELTKLFEDLSTPQIFNNKETLVEKLLTILYYFNNYNPISNYVSDISYAVTVAIFMSLGYKVNGKIPINKSIHLDALLAGTPEAFVLVTRQWIHLEKSETYINSFTKINDQLPTLRHLLEIVHSDFDINSCYS